MNNNIKFLSSLDTAIVLEIINHFYWANPIHSVFTNKWFITSCYPHILLNQVPCHIYYGNITNTTKLFCAVHPLNKLTKPFLHRPEIQNIEHR